MKAKTIENKKVATNLLQIFCLKTNFFGNSGKHFNNLIWKLTWLQQKITLKTINFNFIFVTEFWMGKIVAVYSHESLYSFTINDQLTSIQGSLRRRLSFFRMRYQCRGIISANSLRHFFSFFSFFQIQLTLDT